MAKAVTNTNPLLIAMARAEDAYTTAAARYGKAKNMFVAAAVATVVVFVTVAVCGVWRQLQLAKERAPWNPVPCRVRAWYPDLAGDCSGVVFAVPVNASIGCVAQKTLSTPAGRAFGGAFPRAHTELLFGDVWTCPHGGDNMLLRTGGVPPADWCPKYPVYKKRIASGRARREGFVWGFGALALIVVFVMCGAAGYACEQRGSLVQRTRNDMYTARYQVRQSGESLA
jgi:hypothetical protein